MYREGKKGEEFSISSSRKKNNECLYTSYKYYIYVPGTRVLYPGTRNTGTPFTIMVLHTCT